MTRRLATLGVTVPAAIALGAIAAWPFFAARSFDEAQASSLPTMAPVTADYQRRDWEVHAWEGAVALHHRGDMLSPARLAGEYLQRYRERGDIGDVLRAERAAKASIKAQPHYLPGVMALSASYLTLHRFYDALGQIAIAESVDPGDPALEVQEAGLDMEVGRYARTEHLLAKNSTRKTEDIALETVRSRYLEETGHLSEARDLLHRASSLQNSAFDAPAQTRAWFFLREGEMAFEAGDNDAALADEREALGVFPAYADAGRDLARFECALHEWKACLVDATRSAQLVPYPETLGYQADAERAIGDTVAAAQTEDLIRTVERIGNAQHISDRLLAVYYSDHGANLDDAYRIARNELRARDDIYTEDTLAWAAAMDGRWNEARAAIRKALVFETEDARIQYHAGVIALHFGGRPEAKRRFERALALNPHFHPVFADEARAQLARL